MTKRKVREHLRECIASAEQATDNLKRMRGNPADKLRAEEYWEERIAALRIALKQFAGTGAA